MKNNNKVNIVSTKQQEFDSNFSDELIFKVRAIRKWKNDFIIIVESESGELLLAVENKIKNQVKTNEKVIGEIIDGVVHLNDFVIA